MSVKYKHFDVYSTYFCKFTCYEWMHLLEITNNYDLVYDWLLVKAFNENKVARKVFDSLPQQQCFNLQLQPWRNAGEQLVQELSQLYKLNKSFNFSFFIEGKS